MKGLKNKGREEIKSFRNRASRMFGMGRISKEDFNFIQDKTEQILERIKEMEEEDEVYGSD